MASSTAAVNAPYDEAMLPVAQSQRLQLNLAKAAGPGDAYTGTMAIEYFCDAPGYDALVFHADSAAVTLDRLKVISAKGSPKIKATVRCAGGRSTGIPGAALHISTGAAGDVVVVEMAEPLTMGKVSLVIDFTAKVRSDNVGIYACIAGTVKAGYCLATQFEVTEARKAFPCVDDAYVRSSLALSLNVPAAANIVLANTDEISRTPGAAGTVTVTFAPTRPLPSYVFGFVEGVMANPSKTLKTVKGTMPRMVKGSGCPGLEQEMISVEVVAVGDRAVATFDTALCLKYIVQSYAHFLDALVQAHKQEDGGDDDPAAFARSAALPHTTTRFIALPVMKISGMENDGVVFLHAPLGDIASKPAGKPRQQAQEALARFVAHEMAHHWMGNGVGLPFTTKEGVCLVLETWAAGLLLGRTLTATNKAAATEATAKQQQDPQQQQQQPSSSSAAAAEAGKELTDRTYQEAEAAMAAFVAQVGWGPYMKGLARIVAGSTAEFVDDEAFQGAFA
jgi:hypothetical protein